MDAQTAMEKRVAGLWARARLMWPDKLVHTPPPIRLNNRLKTTAGMAYSDVNDPKYGICIATKLMQAYGFGGFHFEIIPHEVAHIVADQALGSKGHDMPWRAVMNYYNLPHAWRCWNVGRMIEWENKFKNAFIR